MIWPTNLNLYKGFNISISMMFLLVTVLFALPIILTYAYYRDLYQE